MAKEIETGAMVLLSQSYSLLQVGKTSLMTFMDAVNEGDYSEGYVSATQFSLEHVTFI